VCASTAEASEATKFSPDPTATSSGEPWRAFEPGELRVYRGGSLVARAVSEAEQLEGVAS